MSGSEQLPNNSSLSEGKREGGMIDGQMMDGRMDA